MGIKINNNITGSGQDSSEVNKAGDAPLNYTPDTSQSLKDNGLLDSLQKAVVDFIPDLKSKAAQSLKKAAHFFGAAVEKINSKLTEAGHELNRFQLSKIDEQLASDPGNADLLLQRAKLCDALFDYPGAMDSLVQREDVLAHQNNQSPAYASVEAYREELQERLDGIRRGRTQDLPYADQLGLLSMQLKIHEALGQKENIEKLKPEFVRLNQLRSVELALEQAGGLATELGHGWTELGEAKNHFSLRTVEDGRIEIVPHQSFESLSYEDKAAHLSALFRELSVSQHAKGLAEAKKESHKTFHRGMIALIRNDLTKARYHLGDFRRMTRGSHDQEDLVMRDRAGELLRPIELASLEDLASDAESMGGDWGMRMFSGSAGKKAARTHLNYLDTVRNIILAGNAATIEEAMEHQTRLDRGNPPWKSIILARDGLEEVIAGRFKDEKLKWSSKQDDEVAYMQYLLANHPFDGRLTDAQSFQEIPTIKVDGGRIYIKPQDMPPVIRAIIGKEGGTLLSQDTFGKVYTAKYGPSDHERVVLIQNGFILEEMMFPRRFMHRLSAERLSGLKERIQDEGTFDLQMAHQLRSDGSYAAAGRYYEKILSNVTQAALAQVGESEVDQYVSSKLLDERQEILKSIETHLKAQQQKEPSKFREKFGDWPTGEQVDQMVIAAMKTRARLALAYRHIGEKYDQDRLGTNQENEAWHAYNDMEDPNEEYFNYQDRTWDAIADEVVLTAITMPVTMGVGSLVKVGVGSTNLALRLAGSSSRLTRLATVGGIVGARNVGEALAQTGIEAQLGVNDFNLKNFGWNFVMSVSFHGGGAFAGAAAPFKEAVLQGTQSAAKRASMKGTNFAFMMGSQTSIATVMGYTREVIELGHGEITAEGVLAHAARMLGGHFGSAAFHAATGRRVLVAEQRVDAAHRMAGKAAVATHSSEKGYEAGKAVYEGRALDEQVAHDIKNQAIRDQNEREAVSRQRKAALKSWGHAAVEPLVAGARALKALGEGFGDWFGGGDGLMPQMAMEGGAATVRGPSETARGRRPVREGPVITSRIDEGTTQPSEPTMTMMEGTGIVGKLLGLLGKAQNDKPAAPSPQDITGHFSKAPPRFEFDPSQSVKVGRNPDSDIKIADPEISREHAELRFNRQERTWYLTEKSTNGTYINGTRVDAANKDGVRLRDGDRIRIGNETFTFQTYNEKAVLVDRNAPSRMVEIFTRGDKKKYVGYVELINNPDGSLGYKLTDYKTGVEKVLNPEEVLTIQDRDHTEADRALNKRYVRVPEGEAQFLQGSYNQSGKNAKGMMVRVDFNDPRLSGFLDTHIAPIYERLSQGKISKEEAALHAYHAIRKQVPYDVPRLESGIEKNLYSLGDFVSKGVCNERGMLLQVALQYLGIKAEMQKGAVPVTPEGYMLSAEDYANRLSRGEEIKMGRHAWVEVTDPSVRRLKLDPQQPKPIYEGDPGFRMLLDDGTDFDQPAVMTTNLDPESLRALRAGNQTKPADDPGAANPAVIISPMDRLVILLNATEMTVQDENGREVRYRNTKEYAKHLKEMAALVRQAQPDKVAEMEALLQRKGYDRDGVNIPKSHVEDPRRNAGFHRSLDVYEQWDRTDYKPDNDTDRLALQTYRNNKYQRDLDALLKSELAPVEDGKLAYQTDAFQRELSHLAQTARSKVDEKTWDQIKDRLRQSGYDEHGAPIRRSYPDLSGYKGDLRESGGFLMVEGVESYQLPMADGAQIHVGAPVAGSKRSEYLALNGAPGMQPHQARIAMENGKHYITPLTSEGVKMYNGGRVIALRPGIPYSLMDGCTYEIGGKRFEYHAKKTREGLYDIDHRPLDGRERAHYFSNDPALEAQSAREGFDPMGAFRQRVGQIVKDGLRYQDNKAIGRLIDYIQREESAGRLPSGASQDAIGRLANAGYDYDPKLKIVAKKVATPARPAVADGGRSALQPSKKQVAPDVEAPRPQPQPSPPEAVKPAVKAPLPDEAAQKVGLSPNKPNEPRRVSVNSKLGEGHGTLAARTHEGIGYKDRNEDGFVYGYYTDASGKRQVYAVVLDGMGGHGDGDVATEIAGAAIHDSMAKNGKISDAFRHASKEVSKKLGTYDEAPGAVAAGFQIVEINGVRYLDIVRVGDANIKVLQETEGGQWELLHATKDDNAAQMARDAGHISNTIEMRLHPLANMVGSALGGRNDPKPTTERIRLTPGRRIRVVAASDGITDNSNTSDYLALNAKSSNASDLRDNLIEMAMAKMESYSKTMQRLKQMDELIGREIGSIKPGLRKKVAALESFGYYDCFLDHLGKIYDAQGNEITPFVEIPDRPGYWMNKRGHVMDQGGHIVDRFKPDNLTALVYEE